jgi:hypothetical protein
MFKEKCLKKQGRLTVRSYSINPVGILIFIVKIFYYGALLFAPFIFWKVLKLENMIGQYEAFYYIGAYILLAQEFIMHPSHFILRGEPWNERIFIRRVTFQEERGYDEYGY